MRAPGKWRLERRLGLLRVLVYHAIDVGRSRFSIPRTDFESQMRILVEAFSPIALRDLADCRFDGGRLPARPVLVTFDDGLVDFSVHALPILRGAGIPTVNFIPTAKVGGLFSLFGEMVPVLSWADLKRMADSGLCEFGSHTRNHVRLTGLDPRVLRDEVEGSRRDLERELGTAPIAFCYPQGCLDARVVSAVREAGYRCAFGGGGVNWRGTPRFRLRRIEPVRGMPLEVFRDALEGRGTLLRTIAQDLKNHFRDLHRRLLIGSR